jgi:sugar phosphate isomerase/epimerase
MSDDKSSPGTLNRRRFLGRVAATAGLTALPAMTGRAAVKKDPAIRLGIGTYGMKALRTDEALRAIAGIGYDGVEFALMEGWATEPKLLSAGDRRDIRKMLTDLNLALPSMLESLPLKGTPEARAMNLERLKQASVLANDLAPGKPPVIETVLGLKPTDWETAKTRMVGELKDWAKVAESNKVTICFKPHAASAVHSPERALWLLREVGSPNIRLIYDYSHMFVEGFPLAESLKQLLPYTPFIHVKDSVGTSEKHEYLLPGDGKTDYVEYFRLLKQLGYAGFVVVEVSSMIHRKPEYQAVPTAKLCYERLSTALAMAGV